MQLGAPIWDSIHKLSEIGDGGTTRLDIITMNAVAIGGICDVKEDFLPKLRSLKEYSGDRYS